MSRTGRPKRTGVLHRHQKCEMEWALASECQDLLYRGQVAAGVNARTRGICCYPDCNEPIVSYPHAVPTWEGGVHHQLNRAGACVVHSMALRQSGARGHELRIYLQVWLQDWYRSRGLTPAEWMALASGQMTIRNLTADAGRGGAHVG